MQFRTTVAERSACLSLFALLAWLSALSVAGQTAGPSDVRPLPLVEAAEREFKGEQVHVYRVTLAADEFLQVRVEQKGVNVVINLYDPQRRLLASANNPNEGYGPETLSWVAHTSGVYEVEVGLLETMKVSPSEPETERPRYLIRRENKRQATAQDRRRVSVERVFAEAMSSLDGATEDKRLRFVSKLREALSGWQELGDGYMTELTNRLLSFGTFDLHPLPVGETVDRELAAGEWHPYVLKVSAGQVVRMDVREQGANVVMRLYGDAHGGSKFLTQRDFGGGFSREAITHIAEKDATLILVISTAQRVKSGGIGRYKLTAELAATTQEDSRRARAEQLLHEGINDSDNIVARREAVTKLAESLTIWEELGEKYWVGYGSNALGVHFWRMSENQRALLCFSGAYAIFMELGDQHSIANVFSNVSQAAVELGQMQPALDSAIAAEHLFGQLGDTASQASANNNIGRIFLRVGKYKEGMPYLEKGLSLATSLDDRESELVALTSMGAARFGLGQPQEAVKTLKQALALARERKHNYGLSITLHNLAVAYNQMGEHGEARSYLQQALLHQSVSGNGLAEANSFYYLADFLKETNPRLAVLYGKQAVNRYQELRRTIRQADNEVQKEFLRTAEFVYRDLTDLLITQGRLAEAQQVLNAYKDQQYFDPDPALSRQPSPLTLTPREALVVRAYQQASERVKSLGGQLNKARTDFEDAQLKVRLNLPFETQPHPGAGAQTSSAGRVTESLILQLKAESQEAADKFLAVFSQAEAEFSGPVSAGDVAAEVPDKNDMQAALRELNQRDGGKTIALYTLVGGTHFRVLVVTPDKIIARSVPINPEDFERKVIEFWNLLHRSDAYDPRPLGRELYSVLLAPVEADLQREQAVTLLWSLDGVLRYIPVAALYDGRQYVVERYRSVLFTRAGRERLLSAVSPRWTGLGVGASNAQTVKLLDENIQFPALPGVKLELEQIFGAPAPAGGALKGGVLMDARFTFKALLAELKRQPSVVHIASHFMFVGGDEERSFLLLGDGQAVTLKQLKDYPDLFRGVELLTLSACNTGSLQPGANGREIDTLAELAQRQGARAVMASLWSVADASTAELMSAFYREREQRGLPKAEALRQAQLALLNGSRGGGTRGAVRRPAELYGTEAGNINAPRFVRDNAKPYAHPYYWSPFVLIGNGR